MKIGVIIFPGSNCVEDMVYVLQEIMEQEVIRLWHKDTKLQKVDAIILPGGFSFGDYLRAGALAKHSPIMKEVIKYTKNGGFVLGVGNGFQILCETGLLPGALLDNCNQKFICKNVYLKAAHTQSAITALTDTNIALKIPIAHNKGRYYADDNTVRKMRENQQILFHYCNKDGDLTEEANPCGSRGNIASICNNEKNVYGIMPHPERAVDDELGNTDGRIIFESMLRYLK